MASHSLDIVCCRVEVFNFNYILLIKRFFYLIVPLCCILKVPAIPKVI